MNLLFVVYHDLKVEARSQEILKCLKLFGKITVVSYCNLFENQADNCIINKNNKKGYLEFISNARREIRKNHYDVIVLHDAFTANLIRYVKRKSPKSKLVYDASELYVTRTPISTRNMILRIKKMISRYNQRAEEQYLKYADVTIAANIERANIMYTRYKLAKVPIVFDNMHKIEDCYNINECKRKYKHLFDDNKFNILYGGGIAEGRLTYKIAKDIGRLGEKYRLIIVGSVEYNGEKKLMDLLEREKISNCEYVGFVPRAEYKYMIEKSDVTVSAFAMDTVNNIYCASGKAYEGLFLGKPLLAGENPPLKRLCVDYGLGVSTNDFGEGVLELEKNYKIYAQNVQKYIENMNYDERINTLKNNIEKLLQ